MRLALPSVGWVIPDCGVFVGSERVHTRWGEHLTTVRYLLSCVLVLAVYLREYQYETCHIYHLGVQVVLSIYILSY
jgi:hypothetical protein